MSEKEAAPRRPEGLTDNLENTGGGLEERANATADWQRCVEQLERLSQGGGGKPRDEAKALVESYCAGADAADVKAMKEHLEREHAGLSHGRTRAIVEGALEVLRRAWGGA